MSHPLLNMEYLKEKGVTESLSDLASTRFANSGKIKAEIEVETKLVMHDLIRGEDSNTGKQRPPLGDKFPTRSMGMLAMNTEAALIDCADQALIKPEK